MNWVDSRVRSHPILSAVVLVAVASALAMVVSVFVVDVRTDLYKAVITLVFTALIGGVLKIMFDDYTRNNERRASDGTFVANVLADLKAAYDGVAQIRFLIAAHRSAETYGDQMFNLNQYNVQLHNVVRAVETRPDTLSHEPCEAICDYVTQMRDYLKALTIEFQCNYRDLSDLQRVNKAQAAATAQDPGQAGSVETTVAEEKQLWDRLACLPCLAEFISVADASGFNTCFVQPLNKATEHLRAELARIARGDAPKRV